MRRFGEDPAEFVIGDYLRAVSRGETRLPLWTSTFTMEEMARLDTVGWYSLALIPECKFGLLGYNDFVYAQGDMLYRWRHGVRPFVQTGDVV